MMMLNAGKHVLCEKPLAESAAEVKMVNAVAKEKKLFFMEVRVFFLLTSAWNKTIANPGGDNIGMTYGSLMFYSKNNIIVEINLYFRDKIVEKYINVREIRMCSQE